MGQTPSTPTTLTPLQTCLSSICTNSRPNCLSFPSDPSYQSSWVKPYNLDISSVPVAVIRPNSTAEVAAAVKCATANNVKVQARSGGHSFANFGLGTGGLTIDLVNLQGYNMDEKTWYASIGAGTTLGDVDEKLAVTGRAFSHGICPGVGIGGHATIGGLGASSRMWGSALDHIVEVEVVTAEGNILRANEQQNSDLFFALRGAGAGFGIITEFVMRTHPQPGSVIQYSFTFSFGSASDLASTFNKWQTLMVDPTLDRRFGSEIVVYELGIIITGTFYGTQAEFDATGIPARLPQSNNGTFVATDWAGSAAAWIEHEGLYLTNTAMPFYSKSHAFRKEDVPLSGDALSDLFTYATTASTGTPLWFIIFDVTGGAISDVPMNATAYAHRDKIMYYQSYIVNPLGLTDTSKNFLSGFHDKLMGHIPTTSFGTYPGYVDLGLKEGEAQQRYWQSNLAALGQVKTTWDPKDVFHNAQSVRPASR